MEYERCPARFGMAPADLTKTLRQRHSPPSAVVLSFREYKNLLQKRIHG